MFTSLSLCVCVCVRVRVCVCVQQGSPTTEEELSAWGHHTDPATVPDLILQVQIHTHTHMHTHRGRAGQKSIYMTQNRRVSGK